jgi:hypothetical protein
MSRQESWKGKAPMKQAFQVCSPRHEALRRDFELFHFYCAASRAVGQTTFAPRNASRVKSALFGLKSALSLGWWPSIHSP